MRNRLALALLGVLLSASGCVRYLDIAKHDFDQGRYLQASEVLGAHESDLERLSPRGRAEYGAYRGLSLLRLGDHAGAYRWLAYSQRIEFSVPGALAPVQRDALSRAFGQLVQLTGDGRYALPGPSSPSAVAGAAASGRDVTGLPAQAASVR